MNIHNYAHMYQNLLGLDSNKIVITLNILLHPKHILKYTYTDLHWH